MNFRVTLVLGALLLALVGAYFAVGDREEPEETGVSQVETPTLVGYTTDEITGVQVTVGSERIALRRNEAGEWTYGLGSAAPDARADRSRMTGLVSRLA
ncbi:MAG: hypothetical protein HY689_09570, partial [Chloroflexi bacterium]|nr:hypothetical protein [Chloroflexota bacterium]